MWRVEEEFHSVVRKGCWPLSALSTWFLVYLTAAGKHLQERSALALLGEAFEQIQKTSLPPEKLWEIVPVDLWSESLAEELLASEEHGQQGAIASAFSTVMARHGTKLTGRHRKILIAIVLASKMGLVVEDRVQANEAIAALSGLNLDRVEKGLERLQSEYNVVEWDESFKAYDIIGDALPRKQFLAFIRQRVANFYTEDVKGNLFARKGQEWCEHLGDLECDFSEEYRITTREWRYQSIVTNSELLETHLLVSADRWLNATAVDEPRGTVLYCYVPQSENSEETCAHAEKMLRDICRKIKQDGAPILVVLLGDEEGVLGQSLAELAVLEEDLTDEDRVRFGNLIGAHKEKLTQVVAGQVASMLKQRRYIACVKSEIKARRLSRVGTEVFSKIYPKPVTFPFDGFSTSRGNAADTCLQLTSECLAGQMDYGSVIAKPVKAKNRAIQVLEKSWGIFTKTGSVSKRPSHPVLRHLSTVWDSHLQNESTALSIYAMIREMVMPPYGANIASAGLAFGVYVAGRSDQLLVVKGDEQLALSQWLADGLFKGKFLNLKNLEGTILISVAEVSSEWETLLDEWDSSVTYADRLESYKRAEELKKRIPVPPALRYRYTHLEELAQSSFEALAKMKTKQNDAIEKLENGYQHANVGLVAWGTVIIYDLIEKMENEGECWSKRQIDEMRPELEEARQFIVENFSGWLCRRTPRSDDPTDIGNFKHQMINLTGRNLKRLALEELYSELERHTMAQIENAQTAADANNLIREARSWVDAHRDAFRIVRVAAVRGLVDVGKDFTGKCVQMSTRIELPQLNELRVRLANFVSQLKDSEKEIHERASNLWNTTIESLEDVETLHKEVRALVSCYEGCEKDLEDLSLMDSMLQFCKATYLELSDLGLSLDEFEMRSGQAIQEAVKRFDEEEPPWPPDETLEALKQEIVTERDRKSSEWIEILETESGRVEQMTVAEANSLHSKAMNPPATLTIAHGKRLASITGSVEERLSGLEVEWLIERFRKLPASSKKNFLRLAGEISE